MKENKKGINIRMQEMNMSDEQFIELLAEEQADYDGHYVKHIFVDIANGDLIAGTLLSQILYWYLPSKDGRATKLRVFKDGKLWLAKGRDDWWEECRITPKQFDRAISVLCSIGIVEKKIFKFDGNPTIHVRIVPDVYVQLVYEYMEQKKEEVARYYYGSSVSSLDVIGENGFLPKGENGFLPKGKNEFTEKVISLTEITTDTTTEITKERKEYKEKKESRKSNDLLFTVEEKKKADKELEMFNAFWKAYPKKQKRAVALKCWQKLKVDEELFTEIMAGLDRLKQSRQWREQDGKFIPMPSTFLNERRWEDEPEVDKQALVQKFNVLEEQRVKKNYELTPEHPPFHDDIGNTLKWMELVKEWEAKYGMTFQEWEDKNGPLREYMRKHYGRG